MAEAARLALAVPGGRASSSGTRSTSRPRRRRGASGAPARRSAAAAARTSARSGARGRVDRLAVVWIDAHGDLNTPETSPSGNAWGMPLRMAARRRRRRARGRRARRRPQPRSARGRVHRRARDRRRRSIARSTGADAVYVALDVDVLDPSESSCSCPSRAGLSATRSKRSCVTSRASATIAGLGLTGLLATERERRARSRGMLAAVAGL